MSNPLKPWTYTYSSTNERVAYRFRVVKNMWTCYRVTFRKNAEGQLIAGDVTHRWQGAYTVNAIGFTLNVEMLAATAETLERLLVEAGED